MDAVWAGGRFSNRPYGRWRLGMSERIYIRNERGRLEPLVEDPFSTEEELQSLIGEHPELA